jgi:integrase
MNITTLRKVLVTFNQIMKYAVRHSYIDHNPVTDAERPKEQGRDQDEKVHILTPEQINSLVDATEGQMFKMLFRLAIMSGARQGELLGLKWSDIDWDQWPDPFIQTEPTTTGEWYQAEIEGIQTGNRLGAG